MRALKWSQTFPQQLFILLRIGSLRYHLNIAIFFMVSALFRFIFAKGGTTYGHFRHGVREISDPNGSIQRDLGCLEQKLYEWCERDFYSVSCLVCYDFSCPCFHRRCRLRFCVCVIPWIKDVETKGRILEVLTEFLREGKKRKLYSWFCGLQITDVTRYDLIIS